MAFFEAHRPSASAGGSLDSYLLVLIWSGVVCLMDISVLLPLTPPTVMYCYYISVCICSAVSQSEGDHVYVVKENATYNLQLTNS